MIPFVESIDLPVEKVTLIPHRHAQWAKTAVLTVFIRGQRNFMAHNDYRLTSDRGQVLWFHANDYEYTSHSDCGEFTFIRLHNFRGGRLGTGVPLISPEVHVISITFPVTGSPAKWAFLQSFNSSESYMRLAWLWAIRCIIAHQPTSPLISARFRGGGSQSDLLFILTYFSNPVLPHELPANHSSLRTFVPPHTVVRRELNFMRSLPMASTHMAPASVRTRAGVLEDILDPDVTPLSVSAYHALLACGASPESELHPKMREQFFEVSRELGLQVPFGVTKRQLCNEVISHLVLSGAIDRRLCAILFPRDDSHPKNVGGATRPKRAFEES